MERTFFSCTDRIGFSKWRPEDLDLAEKLWGDPQVTKYICARGSFTQEEIQDRLHQELSNEAQWGVQYWPIFERQTGVFLGCCGLRPHHQAGTYELGFHLRPAFWGRGYGTEAATAVIRYAFSTLRAEALFAGHHPDNIVSKHLLCKLDFTPVGKKYYAPTGLYHPSYERRKDEE